MKAVLLMACFSLPVSALAKEGSSTDTSGYEMSVGVTLMSVQVAVLDAKGKYRTDLKPEEFKLYLDGKLQELIGVDLVEGDTFDLGILLDVSGSMRFGGKFNSAKWIIKQLLERLRKEEPAALMIFADGRVETLQNFTKDRAKILKSLEMIEVYGKTALSDALAQATDLIEAHESFAPALVLVTDALENASTQPLDKTLAHLRWKGVPVYALALVADHLEHEAKHPDAGSDYELLQKIADETGGRFFVVDSPASMSLAVALIEKDLRSRYSLSFYGSDSQIKPKKLDVTVDRKGFNVRSRRGYRP